MTNSSYIIEKFVLTTAGDPYRYLPFGEITRGGVTRNVTPEYAARFKLPPFKPPIKLGSHDDAAPAGGHIIKLEVREDGLWVYPEMTEKGGKSVSDGDYRYHSPEVIWDDGALETSDGVIAGPLILGDALLHTPYLGESTAFYSTTIQKELDMQENNVSVPKALWDKFMELINLSKSEEPPTPEQTPVTEAAEFKAVVAERENYAAQLATMKAEIAATEIKTALVAQLQRREDFGAVYEKPEAADEAAAQLATMNEAQRDWVMRNFKAFTAQIKESNLTGEVGTERGEAIGENPRAELNAQVEKIAKEKSVSYADALTIAQTTHADLFKAAMSGK